MHESMSNTWKFETVVFDITLDSSYSTSCSIEISPVLNHIFINKLACPQRRGFPAVPCSLRPSAWRCPSDLHRAHLSHTTATHQLETSYTCCVSQLLFCQELMLSAISRLSKGKPGGFQVASFLLMITSWVV